MKPGLVLATTSERPAERRALLGPRTCCRTQERERAQRRRTTKFRCERPRISRQRQKTEPLQCIPQQASRAQPSDVCPSEITPLWIASTISDGGHICSKPPRSEEHTSELQ